MSIEKQASEFGKENGQMKQGSELAYPSFHGLGVGLTKRELFAAMAMQGLITMAPPGSLAIVMCKESVQLADLLLAELAKEKKE